MIEEENLIGVMNNTRWNALFNGLSNIDEMIKFRVTYIDGSYWPDDESNREYTVEIEQIWGNFIATEYLDIITKIEKLKGALIKPEIIDVTQQVIKLCIANKANISLIESGVRVWGYYRHGEIPELYEIA